VTEKIAMVTGANSGTGKATAKGLAKQSATVVMVCRDCGRGEAAQGEIKAESAPEVVELMLGDLSSQASVRRLPEEFKAKYAKLHLSSLVV